MKALMTKNKKFWILTVTVVLLLTVSVGSTLALLITQSQAITNQFVPTSVTTAIDETIEGGVKKDVKVVNTGDIPAYIRAAVVVTWQNEKGEIYSQKPVAGEDYTDWDAVEGWIQIGDFYYHKAAVEEGKMTGVLIGEIYPMGNGCPDDDYTLCVEILASGIQSAPASVVTDEWGVQLDADGNITGANGN